MQVGEALQLIGGSLGNVSKMPGRSWSISAHKCITGSKLAKVAGSTCSGCYALRNNYNYPSVQTAHARRLASIAGPHWTAAMVFLLLHYKEKYMRWFDSGDLQSVQHLLKICSVAALTPKIKHWLPTRELAIVKAYVASGGSVPANLTIRVSATMVDGPATKAWPVTSGVHTAAPDDDTHICPAPQQDNKCGKCRACWSTEVSHVSYHKH